MPLWISRVITVQEPISISSFPQYRPHPDKEVMQMLSVLIVDDEPIFRMGLRSGINWADLDCEIIGEASNGKEALSIIEEKKPNIILL
ncbi:MAG: response regulator, partial [Eisenbergiella sp.]